MDLDMKVSCFWAKDCENAVASWIACAVFERVEMSDRAERIEFYDLFRENGKWKTNDNNEWAIGFAKYFEDYISDCLDLPKTLKAAMIATIYNDLSLKTYGDTEFIAIIGDIKTLYARDKYNNCSSVNNSDDEE